MLSLSSWLAWVAPVKAEAVGPVSRAAASIDGVLV